MSVHDAAGASVVLEPAAKLALTGEQAAAVARRDGSLFVAAAAGSGKTRVLVERFVRSVLDDGVGVDRILAITFTDKAAGELRARIRRRLVELGAGDLARESDRSWISTIHGFCARILRTHPLAAGIDPDFHVLEETQALRLEAEAFDVALDDFLAADAGAARVDLVAAYTPDRLERMVRTVYARMRTRGVRTPTLPPLAPPAAGDVRPRLEAAIRAAAAELSTPGGGQLVDAARERIEQLREALSAEAPVDGERFAALRIRRGNARLLRAPAFDELERCLEEWIGAASAARAHADSILLSALLERYGARYRDAKEARAALDFDDLELTARDLLTRQRRLRAAIAGRFEQVMVDEYQDTNPLQHELLELVSRGNLFTVGDELQSIYGFRGADVGLFRARRATARAEGRDAELVTSFRARPELIAAVNAAFAPIFGDDYTPLQCPPGAPAAGEEPRVELLLVDRSRQRWVDALGEDAFGDGLSELSPWRAAEARAIARRIGELTGPGGPHRPGEVAVLTRAGTDIAGYERALAERGIPTYAAGGGGYWRRREISDLRAYLSALANPLDELALLGVLASPLGGVSLAALVTARRHARALGRDLWWTLEEAFRPGGDGSAELAAALESDDRAAAARFVERFTDERLRAPRLALETLLDRAVSSSGYDVSLLRAPDGVRRMANVRKLMRLARDFEQENGRDVRGLIDAIDEQELLARREAEAALEGEGLDAVRLMTIHAAKGLEFPVVFVADLGRRGNADDSPLEVSADGRVGLEVASLAGRREPALSLAAIREEQRRDAEAEERRILYVAMTRAQERLVLSGGVDAERWPEPEPLGPPIDWVWRALAPGVERMRDAEAIVDAPSAGAAAERARIRCLLLDPRTVDTLLPAADRAPTAAASVPAAAGPSEPPAFPPLGGGRPLPVARLSYSALASYRRCGYRFYLERVVGMRGPDPRLARAGLAPDAAGGGQLSLGGAGASARHGGDRSSDADALPPLVRGTITHQLLERLDLRRPRIPTRDEILAVARAAGVEASAAAADEIAALVGGFFGSPLFARLRAARRVRTELPFALALTGQPLLVSGVVDVHAEEDGGVLIVDYKTDPLSGPVAAAAARYETQRDVYALAAIRAGGADVEVAYCFLERPDAPVVSRFGAADGERLDDRLGALAAELVAGRFEPTDTPHRELCQGCPGQPALCSWGPERTLAPAPPPAGD